MALVLDTDKKPSQEEQFNAAAEQLEREHGSAFSIAHPDGSCFGFRRMTRTEFAAREARIARGGDDALTATDKLLQVCNVWPAGRVAWNEYVAKSAFETLAYAKIFRDAHGGKDVREADPDQIPEDGDLSLRWLTNDTVTFGFRKPGRAEVKLFQAETTAKQRGEKLKVEPLEKLLLACGSVAFASWVDDNLFGIGAFGDAFVGAYGMTEARVSGK